MNRDRYKLESDKSLMLFEFASIGPKGKIIKVVQFSEINYKNIYNLGFGDMNLETGKIDDTIITNNGDSQKVLATVASTIYLFTDKHPNVWIMAEGSNKVRTRLYRMGITNNLKEIKKDFEIYGLIEEDWYKFKIGEEYEAFLIKRKKH